MPEPAFLTDMTSRKNDHPGYSYERAPWALVTGVGPLNRLFWRATQPPACATVSAFRDHLVNTPLLSRMGASHLLSSLRRVRGRSPSPQPSPAGRGSAAVRIQAKRYVWVHGSDLYSRCKSVECQPDATPRAFALPRRRGEGGRRPDEGWGHPRRRPQPLTPALSPPPRMGEGASVRRVRQAIPPDVLAWLESQQKKERPGAFATGSKRSNPH